MLSILDSVASTLSLFEDVQATDKNTINEQTIFILFSDFKIELIS